MKKFCPFCFCEINFFIPANHSVTCPKCNRQSIFIKGYLRKPKQKRNIEKVKPLTEFKPKRNIEKVKPLTEFKPKRNIEKVKPLTVEKVKPLTEFI